VLGVSSRTVRRLRWRYERYGYDGLLDHRLRRPSGKRSRWPRSSAFCINPAIDTPATYAYIGATLSGLSC